MPPEPFTAQLRRRDEGAPRQAWYRLCRSSFDLRTRASALALWRTLPLKLGLAPLDEHGRSVMARRLAEGGVQATIAVVATLDPRCPRHPHLIADQRCPGCERRPVCILCREVEPDRGCPSCSRWTRFRTAFRRTRVATLLALLMLVAASTWLTRWRIAGWQRPLAVTIVPIAAEGTPAVARYLAGLREADFQALARFLQEQAEGYGVTQRPLVQLTLGPRLAVLPPPRPAVDARWYTVAWWSLALRWWSLQAARQGGLPSADVQLFLLYHQPRSGWSPDQSLGLEQGHVGLVYLFADAGQAGFNQVLIAHELLHTVGASDKYDVDGQPRWPDGYADPERQPLLPQMRAELMAGQVVLAEGRSRFPTGLGQCLVGPATAAEIGWTRR